LGRRTFRLTGGLNNQLERAIRSVAASPLVAVQRHFNRLRYERVRISGAEGRTWTAINLVMVALTLAALLRLTAAKGVTATAIYAVLADVFKVYSAVET
jgi:hypothetical protein